MFGLIVGVAFFFLGAMIQNAFSAGESEDDENIVVNKVTASLKLIGLGILTTTLIVGGIAADDIHRYFKLIILIIGLVMLITFSIASQFMKYDHTPASIYEKWGSPTMGAESPSSDSAGSAPAPGFELLLCIVSIIAIIVIFKKRIKSK